MDKKIILTGDRPTGRLHLGHYVGSLIKRLEYQNKEDYDKLLIMIADTQALTDNYDNPKKIRDNVIEVMIDYLSVGLDPKKIIFFVQSYITALPELTMYYMNLVSLPRLLRNPTVKSEIKLRGFDNELKGVPSGFVNYPISQAADITAFKATIVPVGEDQLPMVEQTNEIVKSFNNIYGEVLNSAKAVIPEDKLSARLPGIDGNAKMSKSLGNGIYLSDDSKTLKNKIRQMYTDPTHIKITDPGKVEGNMVFTYLDVFCKNDHFDKYLSQYKNLEELKAHYQRGGLGDSLIKDFLYNILEELLKPIREKRAYYEKNIDEVIKILQMGTEQANILACETLNEVKSAMGINYFESNTFLIEQQNKYKEQQ